MKAELELAVDRVIEQDSDASQMDFGRDVKVRVTLTLPTGFHEDPVENTMQLFDEFREYLAMDADPNPHAGPESWEDQKKWLDQMATIEASDIEVIQSEAEPEGDYASGD